MKKTLLICLIGSLLACRTQLPITDLSDTEKTALPKMMEIIRKETGRKPKLVIIYQNFNHSPTFGTRDFASIIFDRKSGKKYFFLNKDLRKYHINQVGKTDVFMKLNFILDHYLIGKEDYLKSIEQPAMSGGTYPVDIFDLDIQSNSSHTSSFSGIYLGEDGKPEIFKLYKSPK